MHVQTHRGFYQEAQQHLTQKGPLQTESQREGGKHMFDNDMQTNTGTSARWTRCAD